MQDDAFKDRAGVKRWVAARKRREEAQQVLERIREHIRSSNQENPELSLSLSLGVATTDQANLVETMRTADARMYEDKRRHKELLGQAARR